MLFQGDSANDGMVREQMEELLKQEIDRCEDIGSRPQSRALSRSASARSKSSIARFKPGKVTQQ